MNVGIQNTLFDRSVESLKALKSLMSMRYITIYITTRRKWQPTLVFLPGEPYGWRSLAGYSPEGHIELDRTETI